jgi:hypothetical protein
MSWAPCHFALFLEPPSSSTGQVNTLCTLHHRPALPASLCLPHAPNLRNPKA